MTRYGQDNYGQNPNGAFVYYGLTFPPQAQASSTTINIVQPQYSVEPFIAQSIDYEHILLNWTQPDTAGWSDFRLLSNRFGFPVDQNDGVLLLDSGGPGWPGSSYLDPNVIPGTYHHYGIYLLVNDQTTTTTNVTISPALNKTMSTWLNGYNSALLSTTSGTATVTNNIPAGAPYPYGIKYVAPSGGAGTCSFPYNGPVTIQLNTVYTVNAWVYSPTGQVILGMDWETGANQQVSNTVNTISVPVNTWTQVTSQVTSPGGGVTLGSAIFYATTAGTAPAYTMFATGITIQQGTASTVSSIHAQGVWVRAGIAACLAPTDFNTTSFLLNTIPEYFKQSLTGDLTTDESGNLFLQQYLSIIAWSVDYLKTALTVTQNVNNPDIIPLNDLFNLALTVGFPFEPEISAGVIRQGIKNVSQLVQQRGTLEGIVAYVTNLAGMALDLQVGYNMMLDDNTSNFIYPKALGIWNSTQVYQSGDIVDYLQYKYTSAVNNNVNVAPTGTTGNNANWNALYYFQVTNAGGFITNPVTNWPSTYEPRWANKSNQYPNDVTALREVVGILDPLDSTHYHSKGLRIRNNSGSGTTIDIRSVSRTTADITAVNVEPDPTQVINDGIPVPYTLPQQAWSATTTYQTGQIVVYQGLPFQALKASTNVAPSSNYTPSNEWQPIGYDARIQMMTSAYTSGDIGGSSVQFSLQPYVSLYDQTGSLVAKLIPRVNTTGGQQADANCVATTNQAFNHTSSTILTASANGITTIDGVVISSTSQNVLLTGQTSQLDNGIYDVTQVGTASVPTILTRYGLAASGYPGFYAYVSGGTVNAGTTWYCTNTTTPTLGTTAITFSKTTPNQSVLGGSLLFDSFAKPSDWGANVTTHSPEVGQVFGPYSYTAQTNNFVLDAFNNGVVRPSNPNGQCLVTTNYSSAAAMLGITIVTPPTTAGFIMGLAGRVASSTSYIRVDQNTITQNNAGVLTVLATHTTAAQAGDRLTALFNGNNITAYVNGTQVSTVTTAFNNGQTNFGYVYESVANLSGTVQKRATIATPRRLRRSIRATTQVLRGNFIWHLNGTVQPWVTRPVPRRRVARAVAQFKAVTTTNRAVGQVQPRTTLVNQRSLAQRSRASFRFVHVTTTNLMSGTVQPDSTVMLPRRRTTRAYVHGVTPTYSYHTGGSVQSRATLANQHPKIQRSRALPYGAGHAGSAFHVPGTRQHQIAVYQRSIAQRARARVKYTFVGAGEPGFSEWGPAGTTQRNGFVAQRTKAQRHRGMVGNQFMPGDVESSTSRANGSVQSRATVPTPRRTSSRARIASGTVGIGHLGSPRFGPSGTVQPMASRPVQRLLSQRSRVVIKGVANYEIGPEQSRGPNGVVQPYPTSAETVAQRSRTQRSRAFVQWPVRVKTKTYVSTVGGIVTRRARTPHRRTNRNG